MWRRISVLVALLSIYFFLKNYHVYQEKKAWVTLITKDSYLPGVIALSKSLKLSNTKFPLIVMTIKDKLSTNTIEEIKKYGGILYEVNPLYPKEGVKTSFAFSRFSEVWTKLKAWSITGYDKLCYLDADMLVVQNMDEIFDLLQEQDDIAVAYDCMCNPRNFTNYPAERIPDNCPYTQCKDHNYPFCSIGARNESNYENLKKESIYFNTGLFIYRPGQQQQQDIEREFHKVKDLSTYAFADQDFLNFYFKDNWRQVPFMYHAIKLIYLAHPELWNEKIIKNIHYINEKPWDYKLEDEKTKSDAYYPLYKIWWSFYEKKLDHL